VEAARFAPSAENAAPWRFLIIDDPEILKEVANRAFTGIYAVTRWAAKAPVLVVVLVELNLLTHRIGKQVTGIHYYLIDVGIAGEHFILQAQELGLGTCWIGWFNARGVRKALNIPPRFKPIELIAVGYPDSSELKEKRRKQLHDICWFNKIR
jgi:nitroreductase